MALSFYHVCTVLLTRLETHDSRIVSISSQSKLFSFYLPMSLDSNSGYTVTFILLLNQYSNSWAQDNLWLKMCLFFFDL